jgi:hypothetical protein
VKDLLLHQEGKVILTVQVDEIKELHMTHSYKLKLNILKCVKKCKVHAEAAQSLDIPHSTASTYVKQDKLLKQDNFRYTVNINNIPRHGAVTAEQMIILRPQPAEAASIFAIRNNSSYFPFSSPA